MKQPLLFDSRSVRRATLPLLFLLAPLYQSALAQQFNYNPLNAQNVAGTYVDLGTSGTVIPTANVDDANSAPQNIGFAFPFNNMSPAPTTFTLNTNGFMKLSSEALSDPFWFFNFAQTEVSPSTGQTIFPGSPMANSDTRNINLLAPFATDLTGGTAGGTEYRVATTGTAPNRVCTIQWKNVRDKPKQASSTNTTVIGTQYDNFSFQVKLYETSGQIEFVYGPVAAGAGPNNFRTVDVGIKGSTADAGNLLMVDKNSSTPWASSIFVDNYYVNSDPHNVRLAVLSDVGRTYRFRANITQDATVQAIYTLGQVPVGGTHVVQASVRNAGTQALNNLPVRLAVTGINSYTNTQTISSLAPGATTIVSFPGYALGTRVGTNDITVSVPQDAYPSGDSRTETQTLTVNTRNYAPATVVAANTGSYGFGTNAGITAVKYNAATSTSILAVTNFFSPLSNSVGRTVYGIVANSAGAILARTPDYVVGAGDIGTFKTFSFPSSVALNAGDFYVGIAQPAGSVAHFPVGRLEETPTRSGAFYVKDDVTSGTFNDRASSGFGKFLIGAVVTNPVLGTTQPATVAQRLLLWPNPATGTSSVRLRLGTAAATVATPVTVTDALGRVVTQATLPAGSTETTISTANLPAGLYLVRCAESTGRLLIE